MDGLEITVCMYLYIFIVFLKWNNAVNNWFVTMFLPLNNLYGCHSMTGW